MPTWNSKPRVTTAPWAAGRHRAQDDPPIGTCCIAKDRALLHSDREIDPMTEPGAERIVALALRN